MFRKWHRLTASRAGGLGLFGNVLFAADRYCEPQIECVLEGTSFGYRAFSRFHLNVITSTATTLTLHPCSPRHWEARTGHPSLRLFRDSGGTAPLLQLAQVMRRVRHKQRDGDVPDGRRVGMEFLRRGSREVV